MAITRLLFKKISATSSSYLSFTTSGAMSTPNIYGSSSLNIADKDALATNTNIINALRDANINFFSFCGGGSTLAWQNYYTIPGGRTDGYHTCDADALKRGRNPALLLSGKFDNSYGGLDFFTDYTLSLPEIVAPNAVLGLNTLEPLAPYSTAINPLMAVDFTTLNVGGMIAQLEFAISAVEAKGVNVKVIELGLEEVIDANFDLFRHIVGTTGVDVYTTMLNTTNSTSGISVLQYLRSRVPNAILSADGFLWYTTPLYPDWNQQAALLDVDAIRQYWNMGEGGMMVTGYDGARSSVARYPEFFNFINSPDFNGKKVYISQFVININTEIVDTIAQGLAYVELYLTLTNQNPLNQNKVVGLCQQKAGDMFGAPPSYQRFTQYYYFKLLGQLFSGENVTLITDITGDANLVICALQYGDQFKIGVLNPTATTINYNGIKIDGVTKSFSSSQYYSPDGTVTTNSIPLFTTQTTMLQFFPYSFSVISTILT